MFLDMMSLGRYGMSFTDFSAPQHHNILMPHGYTYPVTGVFDPPPEGLSVPWLYLLILGVAVWAVWAVWRQHSVLWRL